MTRDELQRLEYEVTKRNLEIMTEQRIQQELDRLQKIRMDAIHQNFRKLESQQSQFLRQLTGLRSRRKTLATISTTQVKILGSRSDSRSVLVSPH